MDYSRDRAELRFKTCFDSLFVIFFPDFILAVWLESNSFHNITVLILEDEKADCLK